MTFTVEIGYWIAPALITVFFLIAATVAAFKTSGEWLSGIAALFFYVVAMLFSVIVWLVWGVMS
jgi:ABC-type multidrug transport system permease subunit